MVSNQIETDIRMQNPVDVQGMRRLGTKTGMNVSVLALEGENFIIPAGQRLFQNYQGIIFYEITTCPENVCIPSGKVLVCLEGNRTNMDRFWQRYRTETKHRVNPSSKSSLLSRLASYKSNPRSLQ